MYKSKLISNNEIDFKNHTFGDIKINNFKSNIPKKIHQMDLDQINDLKLFDVHLSSKINKNSDNNIFLTPQNRHKTKINESSDTKLIPYLKTVNKSNKKIMDEIEKRNKEITEQIRKLLPSFYRKNKMKPKIKVKQKNNNNIIKKKPIIHKDDTFITKIRPEDYDKINRYKSGVNMHFLKNCCDNIVLNDKNTRIDYNKRKTYHSKKMDLNNYEIFKDKYLYTDVNVEEEAIDKNIRKLMHKNELLFKFLKKKKKGKLYKKQALKNNRQTKEKDENNNYNFITCMNDDNNNFYNNINKKSLTHTRNKKDANENIHNLKKVSSNYLYKNIFPRKNSNEGLNLYFENVNKNINNTVDPNNSIIKNNKNFVLFNSTMTFNKFNKTSTADSFNQTLSGYSYNNTKNNLYNKTFLSNSNQSNCSNINNSVKIFNTKSHAKFKNKTLIDIKNLLSELNIKLDPCFLKEIKDKTKLKHFLYYFKIMNVEYGINQNFLYNNDKIKDRKNDVIKMKHKCKNILNKLDKKNNYNLDKFVREYKKSELGMSFSQYYNYLLMILQNYNKKIVPNTFEIKEENKGKSEDLKYSNVVQKHKNFIKLLNEQLKEGQYANKLVENFINKAENDK